MSYSAGTKVPSDSQESRIEGAGTILSDSLAAESLKQGGDFGSGSGIAASSQPAHSSTTTTTDTSSATTLAPAPDAEARQAHEAWNESAQLNAGQGLGKAAGIGPTYATPAAMSAAAGNVPTDKPHGKNITEGGFDSSAPNASFTSEIGTKKDPSRVAVGDIQRRDAETDAGSGTKEVGGIDNKNPFEAVGGDTSA